MNNTPPLFSILVANYNNARFFGNFFPNIINQTYQNIEVIFIDDGSTDNSLEEVKKYADQDKRIKVFKNDKNMGSEYTKKRNIELSSGKYFAFADPDDFVEISAVEKVMEQFLKDDSLAMVYTNFYLTNEDLSYEQKYIYPDDVPDNKILMFGFTPNHFAAFSREKYDLTPGLDISLKRVTDRDLVLLMEEVGRVVRIPEYLYHYRINSNSISHNLNAYKAQYWAWQARYRACERRGLSKEDVYSEIMSYIDGKRFDFSTTADYKLGKKLLALPRWIKYKLLKRK
ncbi:MAG: glycosyltransferase [Bacteroidales bacterium]|nr:glycosyltransferase [Bacteroidales bacterium]